MSTACLGIGSIIHDDESTKGPFQSGYESHTSESTVNFTVDLRPVIDPLLSSVEKLDEGFSSRMLQLVGEDSDIPHLAVNTFNCGDGQLLRCGDKWMKKSLTEEEEEDEKEYSPDEKTLFGILENQKNPNSNSKEVVNVSFIEAECPRATTNCGTPDVLNKCACDWHDGCWNRDGYPKAGYTDAVENCATTEDGIHLKLIDLRKLQKEQNDFNTAKITFSDPGTTNHFLQSVLTCPEVCSSDCGDSRSCQNCIYGLIMRYDPDACDDEELVDNIILKQKDVDDIIQFKVGDTSPSFYLHAMARFHSGSLWSDLICGISSENTIFTGEVVELLNASFCAQKKENFLMLVYRHLPPRPKVTKHCPDIKQCVNDVEYKGCLWEAYYPPPLDDDDATDVSSILLYRQVSPPYLSYKSEYQDANLDELISPKNFQSIRNEAMHIPKWTAWPEKTHYGNDTTSWTVFPLCHTFPANDISKRKWIQQTCAFVPRTTALLKKHCDTHLRTALFSRLTPRSTLSAHTGWSDLANHVLRVHIPLFVPKGKNCGLWVDGCVEYHHEGKIVIFDDSKVHRAFNYSQGERLVLILDFKRPDKLPLGTAVGGHTEELDSFIDQLTS